MEPLTAFTNRDVLIRGVMKFLPGIRKKQSALVSLVNPLSRLAWFLVFAFAPACISTAAHGQHAARPPDKDVLAGRDPAAIALRDKMVKTYRDLNGINEKITQRQWKSRPEEALTIEIEFRFRKPNRLYLNVDYPNVGRPGRWQLVYSCDGRTLTVYNSANNEYETARSPAHLDRLILPQALRCPEFAVLLREVSPFDDLEKSAIVRYSEAFEEDSDGPRHTLRLDLQQDGAKRALRYRTGMKDYLVHGFSLTIVPDEDAVSPFADPEVRSTVEARYTLVESNPRFTDADFRFNPPTGATERKPSPKVPARGRATGGSDVNGPPL